MPRVLTDANVLYPSLLRNLLMYLAAFDACELRWTDQIHDEWIRNLVSKSGQDPRKLHRTRELMERANPEARVTDYEHLIPALNLPDPADRHVLAAAIVSESAEILTFNLRDFPPAATESLGTRAVHPDPWLCGLLDAQPETVRLAATKMLGSLKNPPLTPADLRDALHRLNLPQAAERLSHLLTQEDTP